MTVTEGTRSAAGTRRGPGGAPRRDPHTDRRPGPYRGLRRGLSGRRRGTRRIMRRTLAKAWDDGIFSMSAAAAFWQTLSLPPLFLALLGSLGYLGDWIGPAAVRTVDQRIIEFSGQVFTPDVVEQIIEPTARSILTGGRADVASIGFLIALFAGSSAVSSLVDSVTVAHRQYEVRHPVWQRLVALGLYLVALLVALATLPLLALGPELVPQVLPVDWRPTAGSLIERFYYPGIGLLIVVALTTFYRVALPRSLPWRRGLPGALLAMVVFVLSVTGLRLYISWVTTTGYTYGALATPIAFLLVAFFAGFSVVLGAQLNNAVEEVWPARPSRRQRRLRRRGAMRRLRERLREQVPALAPRPRAASEVGPRTAPEGAGTGRRAAT